MKTPTFALFTLTTTLLSAAALDRESLWVSGEDGYHTYRIPSLLATRDGSVLAFCEGRKTSASDHGDVDLIMKRSTDGGLTWSPQVIVHEEGGDAKITIGNPCPVVDGNTGTIWLPFTRDNQAVFVTSSTDDGRTWAAPRNISADTLKPEWDWVATGPGVGIQLDGGPNKGRLLIPCDHRIDYDNGAKEWNSHMMFSDDGGVTWQIGAPIQSGGNECQVIERRDGSLLVNTRMQGFFAGARGIAMSNDGGATWSAIEKETQLPCPKCQGSLLRLEPGVLLFSNPDPGELTEGAAKGERIDLTVRMSHDDGKTWPVARLLHRGPSAYSSLARLPDGTVLCLYEGGEESFRETLTLARFSPDWLYGTTKNAGGEDRIEKRPEKAPGENDTPTDFDVVVYGATPGGIAAAVNAAREGCSVALLQEDGHIGGLTSGGLSNPDFRSFECLGGTWREFMHRVERHYAKAYGENSRQVIDSVRGAYSEPRVARRVFDEMLAETGRVTIFLHHRLSGAQTEPVGGAQNRTRLTFADFLSLKDDQVLNLSSRVFIDGTYEGDLIAAAGVETIVGCESKSAYNESLAFDEPNRWVMAYNFRACLTTDPDNRLPIEKPEGYNPSEFDLLREGIVAGSVPSLRNPGPTPAVLKVRPIPNQKADFNDDPNGPISMALKNINHPWAEGDPETRRGIYEAYKHHTLSLFWFLGNDPALPEEFRSEMLRWGLPKDEWPDNSHWSPALYVREGRRMIGEYIFTEHDTQAAPGSVRAPVQRDSIAVADYALNSHGVHSPEPGVNIGRHGKSVVPYGIPYGVILPKSVDGLLSPVAVSASRVGYTALRMEPSWTALGQAAGIAAAIAIRENIQLRDVAVPDLQERLHELGAMTVYISDLAPLLEIPKPEWDPPGTFSAAIHPWPVESPWFRAAQFFGTRGIFADLIHPDTPGARASRTTGQWSTAFPRHSVGFEEAISPELAREWSSFAGVGERANLSANGTLTRGEFLNHLYRELTK